MNKHPEQADDEVFIGNTAPTEFSRYDWTTKRMGIQAIRPDSRIIEDYRPVFVKRNEIEAKLATAEKDEDKLRLRLILRLGRWPLHGEDVVYTQDMEEVLYALHQTVSIRNQMGGDLYWNIANDQACKIGGHAVSLGADRNEIRGIIGHANAR